MSTIKLRVFQYNNSSVTDKYVLADNGIVYVCYGANTRWQLSYYTHKEMERYAANYPSRYSIVEVDAPADRFGPEALKRLEESLDGR